MMKSKVDEHITNFIFLKEKCLSVGYVVRHSHNHEQYANMLKNYVESTAMLKETAIKENDEDSANTLLSTECFCQALWSEMLMWLAFKKGDPNEAWNYLVDAQDRAKASTRAKYIERLQQEEYIEKLNQIEKVVFPPQSFMSPSYVIKSVKCSICNENYRQCSHIDGRAYNGRLCSMQRADWEIRHIAFVSYPFNKKVRIVELWQNGKWLDYMSWTDRQCPNPAENKSQP